MRIRKGLEEDWRRIKELEDGAIRCYYQAGFSQDEVLPRSEEDIRFLLNHTQLVVAEVEGDLVGYMSFYSVGPYLHLEEHVVDARYWRQGVGTELLQYFFQVGMESTHCRYYTLLVFPEASWARNCYLRSGFRSVDLEQMDDLTDEKLLRMVQSELKMRTLGRGRILMIKDRVADS